MGKHFVILPSRQINVVVVVVVVVVVYPLSFFDFCFQSQTYSFEVAQEHIETLQRK